MNKKLLAITAKSTKAQPIYPGQITVFVVEDNPVNQKVFTGACNTQLGKLSKPKENSPPNFNFTVQSFTNGEEAVKALSPSTLPDVVLMDFNLSDQDGAYNGQDVTINLGKLSLQSDRNFLVFGCSGQDDNNSKIENACKRFGMSYEKLGKAFAAKHLRSLIRKHYTPHTPRLEVTV